MCFCYRKGSVECTYNVRVSASVSRDNTANELTKQLQDVMTSLESAGVLKTVGPLTQGYINRNAHNQLAQGSSS